MKFYFLLISFTLLLAHACHVATDRSTYVSEDFTKEGLFTSGIEGPAVDRKGNVYAVNFEKQGTIGKVEPTGKTTLFIELPPNSIGNGIRFDTKGDMYVADYTNHNVLKINPSSKSITVHAHGAKMNQPNDLAITSRGVLFASDPNWKEETGNLWRIDPDGTVQLLEEGMGTTNGVEVSPDEKTLYVNESIQRNVWAYDLAPSGAVSNKRLFIRFSDFGMDGMRCDSEGNLFITRHGKGAVAMVAPNGKLLREIELAGKNPSNIAFGGKDGRTCYVTLQDRGMMETFRAEYPGRAWLTWQEN